MARVTGTVGEQFYAAAQRFVDAALRADDSLFTPGRPIWTAVNIDELYRRFAAELDTSDDSFENKFHRELEGAPAENYQLAREPVFLHLPVAPRTHRFQAKT